MNSKEFYQRTQSSCPEILIIQSGINSHLITESLVEANSDMSQEEIVYFLFNQIKTTTNREIVKNNLISFILNKSKEESVDCYLDYYLNILQEFLIMLSFIYDNIENYKAYRNNVLKFNTIKLLPTSDVLLSTENEPSQTPSDC